YCKPATESRQAIESRPAPGSRLGGRQVIEAHSGRAHDVVYVEHRIGEIRRAEGSQQIADWSWAIDQELIEGVDGGFPLEREGLLLVQHAKAGVDSGQNGVLAQESGAKAVNRRYPGSL